MIPREATLAEMAPCIAPIVTLAFPGTKLAPARASAKLAELRGRVAQLGERIVRNDEAGGSSPPTSTKLRSRAFLWPVFS